MQKQEVNLLKKSKKEIISWIKSFIIHIDDDSKFNKFYESVLEFDDDVQQAIKEKGFKFDQITIKNIKLTENSYKNKLAKRAVCEAEKLLPMVKECTQKSNDLTDYFEIVERLFNFTTGELHNDFQEEQSYIKSKEFLDIKLIYYYNKAKRLAPVFQKSLNHIKNLHTLDINHTHFDKEPKPIDNLDYYTGLFIKSIQLSGLDRSFFPFHNYKRDKNESTEKKHNDEILKEEKNLPENQWHPVRDLVYDIKVKYILLYIKLIKRKDYEIQYYRVLVLASNQFGIKDYSLLGLNNQAMSLKVFKPTGKGYYQLYLDVRDNTDKYIKEKKLHITCDMLKKATKSRLKSFLNYKFDDILAIEKKAKAPK